MVSEAFQLVKASFDWSVFAGIDPGMQAKPLPLHELSQNCVHAFFMGLHCLLVTGCFFKENIDSAIWSNISFQGEFTLSFFFLIGKIGLIVIYES